MRARRLVVVGLHGGGPYYFGPLLAAGRTPVVQAIGEAGALGPLASTWPVSAGAWVSILTGLDVDQHGILDTVDIDARRFPSISDRPTGSQSYRRETVFDLASRAGLSVAGVVVPMSGPPWPVDGVLIPGVPEPNEVQPPTYPPELQAQLGPMSLCRYDEVDRTDLGACRRYLDFELERVLAVSRSLGSSRRYDLLFTVFKTPDLANHLLHGSEAAVDDGRALIEEYHVKTDAALGELVADLGSDVNLVVLSDHGSGPLPPLQFRVSVWLEQMGYLARRRGPLAEVGTLSGLHRLYRAAQGQRAAWRLWSLLPAKLQRVARGVGHHWSFVDLGRTRVYPVDHFYPLAGLEINLRGRQARGIVDQQEFETLRDDLIRDLSGLRLPDGRAVCRRLLRREELFDGPEAGRLADVIVELDPDVVADLRFGQEVLAPNLGKRSYPYLGYHLQEGLLALAGPDIERGLDIHGARILDMAPTILELLGVPLPPGRRGRSLVNARA